MPPKYKFTKEEIIQAALDITRQRGFEAVTARAVGEKLNSSPKVIFSLFQNMETLQQAVITAAYGLYLEFLQTELARKTYPPYKATGMGYIRFAREEPMLFQLLFMCDRSGIDQTPGEDTDLAITLMMRANPLTREQAERLHLEMWLCVHGIATMLATSFLTLEWELISQILTDVYQGIRTRMLSGEGSI